MVGDKKKVKDKDNAKLLLCPFSALKDTCQTVQCMAWNSTDKDNRFYGHCVLIPD